MKPSSKEKIIKVVVHCILITALATLVFPFIWMATGAFKNANEVIAMPPSLLPSKFTLDNYNEIAKLFKMEIFIKNSIIVSVVTTIVQVIFCIMAAFAFAKFKFKGKELLFILYLMTMMIPFQVSMTMLYRIFVYLNLRDTLTGMILPGTFSVFGIFLVRQHMMTISDSFIEAAAIDGASYFRILVQIIVPLCKPVIATLSVFAFMNSWNSFIWPLIIVDSQSHMTLPLGLNKLQGRWRTDWNLLMAGNFIVFIPMFVVYIFAQKHFIKSIALSGVKG